MKSIYKALLLLASLVALSSCVTNTLQPEKRAVVLGQDLGGLPYHPLVQHLDLSILAYKLYAQTLVWPLDPYYEEIDGQNNGRAGFMKNVREWAKVKGEEQRLAPPKLGGYRGPGILGGFEDNSRHDPIVFRYDRLYPWSSTITQVDDRWTEYLTSNKITDQIRDVHMCYRQSGQPEGAVAMEQVATNKDVAARGARDVLLAFEGGTGDKGIAGQPVSQSLMGFVLVRYLPGSDDYDVHIAFRGSRSGSVQRAIRQAYNDNKAKGNPDWITDVGFDPIQPELGGALITTKGSVFRGFARSTRSILPQLFHCLNEFAGVAPGSIPKRIFVTGHSLGGALAQQFVSAVLMGKGYGPNGTGALMPVKLQAWPWRQIKLITFSSPRAGTKQWAQTLTKQGLSSEFFSTRIDTLDRTALSVTDPSILPRLTNVEQPAGFRVTITTDPVTTAKIIGGKHVGKSVYLNDPSFVATFALPDVESHELWKVRDFMLSGLNDPRIPPTAWRYRDMQDINPDRNPALKGSLAEFVKLKEALERYYRRNGISFDHATFDQDFETFKNIFQSRKAKL